MIFRDFNQREGKGYFCETSSDRLRGKGRFPQSEAVMQCACCVFKMRDFDMRDVFPGPFSKGCDLGDEDFKMGR